MHMAHTLLRSNHRTVSNNQMYLTEVRPLVWAEAAACRSMDTVMHREASLRTKVCFPASLAREDSHDSLPSAYAQQPYQPSAALQAQIQAAALASLDRIVSRACEDEKTDVITCVPRTNEVDRYVVFHDLRSERTHQTQQTSFARTIQM